MKSLKKIIKNDLISVEQDKLNHARVCHNVSYGEHEFQKLDLYSLSREQLTPLVFWFHGGGFIKGDKEKITCLDPVLLMLDAGLTVAIPNYRLAHHAPYPAAMMDGLRAVQFGKYSAGEWNIDPDKVAVAGSSAGGMIALWIAFHDELADPGSADPVTRISSRVRAITGYNTQTTIDPRILPELIGREGPVLLDFFGLTADSYNTAPAHALYQQASAINLATRNAPPVFLCYDGKMLPVDSDLTDEQRIHHPVFGKYLHDKLASLGVECEWYYPEQESNTLTPQDMYVKMVEFLKRHLNKS